MPTVTLKQGPVSYTETGTGRPVVFVHGYLMGGELWHEAAAALAAHDMRCIMPTWPLGAHAEPMAAGADLTPPGLAAIIADFVAELELRDAVLVGNDTGGALIQIVAARHGGVLGGLVLTNCDAFANFPPSFFKALVPVARIPGGLTLTLQPFRWAVARRSPLGYGLLSRTGVDHLAREWVRPALADRRIRRDLRKVTAALRPEHTLAAAERLHGFDRPALVAWTSGDPLFPEEHGRRLATLLPQGRFVPLPGDRTFSMVDHPAELAGAIASAFSPAARTQAA
jgi:pimeloyl-ACP methyl ester carboxylesterase